MEMKKGDYAIYRVFNEYGTKLIKKEIKEIKATRVPSLKRITYVRYNMNLSGEVISKRTIEKLSDFITYTTNINDYCENKKGLLTTLELNGKNFNSCKLVFEGTSSLGSNTWIGENIPFGVLKYTLTSNNKIDSQWHLIEYNGNLID